MAELVDLMEQVSGDLSLRTITLSHLLTLIADLYPSNEPKNRKRREELDKIWQHFFTFAEQSFNMFAGKGVTELSEARSTLPSASAKTKILKVSKNARHEARSLVAYVIRISKLRRNREIDPTK